MQLFSHNLTIYLYDSTQTWAFSLKSSSSLISSYVYNRYWRAFEVSTDFPFRFSTDLQLNEFEIQEPHEHKFAVFKSRLVCIKSKV